METNSYEQVREQVRCLPSEAQQTVRSVLELPTSEAQQTVRSVLELPATEQKQLLAELPKQRTVRVRRGVARDYSAEQDWLEANRHLYRGEYLAVSGGQLLAHGTDPRAVMAAARATGQRFLISRVPHADEVYGGGLW